MWCKNCDRISNDSTCELCGGLTEQDTPVEVYWCATCKVPIMLEANDLNKRICPLCSDKINYLCADLRPVFPEERLLLEILSAEPFKYINNSVWASNNRYYIDGCPFMLTAKYYSKYTANDINAKLKLYNNQNNYIYFNQIIDKFISVNKNRYFYLLSEATEFIKETAKTFPSENIVISFSGGKDSTVTADLTTRALSNPYLVHIFGDTTLEFDTTLEYAKRYKKTNPKAIFKTATNKDQDFFKVCEDIGPPARMLRWCCSMFKTGPITRVINSLYKNNDILTFYGIRKCESVSRSKYNRVEDSADSIKIQKQTVASPIFLWKDIDIWLYIFHQNIDFNFAYRLGYDRVGCWCCPNNNERAQFLSQIYMPEKSAKWHNFLVNFAKQIGKQDAEVYVNSGKWKARQGGNGLPSAKDVKLRTASCTAEENAIIYKLLRPFDDSFLYLFLPFGKIAKELGRKLINETIIVDIKTSMPIISIQPFSQNGFEHSVKIKIMNVSKPHDLHRMAGYQIRKFNACRKCLKCESLCKYGAISIIHNQYIINESKCQRCKMCVTAKYLESGCMMNKYLLTKDS